MYDHPADIHACGTGRFQQHLAEEIITYTAHHGDVGAQAGTLQRLIGAFAAGGHVKLLPVDGLTGRRNPLRGGDYVHHKAANNKNARFSLHDLVCSCYMSKRFSLL